MNVFEMYERELQQKRKQLEEGSVPFIVSYLYILLLLQKKKYNNKKSFGLL